MSTSQTFVLIVNTVMCLLTTSCHFEIFCAARLWSRLPATEGSWRWLSEYTLFLTETVGERAVKELHELAPFTTRKPRQPLPRAPQQSVSTER